MSRSTCSNWNPRVATRPEASAQNMNASSASGLCPRRICIERGRLTTQPRAVSRFGGEPAEPCPRDVPRTRRSESGAAEEPALELRQNLLAREGRDAVRNSLLLEHGDIVLE